MRFILKYMVENTQTAKVRDAVVSGIFYPEDSVELRESVVQALKKASPPKTSSGAILSPHAGFDYSGSISAAAWAAASDRQPKTVVILGPYHRAQDPFVCLPESDSFQTPLGKIPVNRRYVKELESSGTIFHINDIPHFEEHSVEVQLPFLQVLFPDAAIVPMLLGKPTPSAITSLAHSLDLVFSGGSDSVLFVVSTNFSCYSSIEESERRFDRVLGYIASRADAALYDEYKSDTPDMCGVGCLAALLQSRILKGLCWSLQAKGNSASRRATASEKVVYYAAGAWT